MKKIGLFGGTFDPPHIGHFIIAQEVKQALQLDEVWFVPTNDPPHKAPAFFTAMERYHMLKCVTAESNDFFVNKIELEREGKSYTIDTVRMLRERYLEDEFYFIIGGDMIAYMPKWYKIDELASLVRFVGVNRHQYVSETPYPVVMVDVPMIDISSTDIRTRLQRGEDVTYFLPYQAYLYMKEHGLDEYNEGR